MGFIKSFDDASYAKVVLFFVCFLSLFPVYERQSKTCLRNCIFNLPFGGRCEGCEICYKL